MTVAYRIEIEQADILAVPLFCRFKRKKDS